MHRPNAATCSMLCEELVLLPVKHVMILKAWVSLMDVWSGSRHVVVVSRDRAPYTLNSQDYYF